MGRIPLIIDVDAGVDDTLALVYALLNPSYDVRGITAVAGNVGVDNVTRNIALALNILEPYLHSVPTVARGAAKPLRHHLFTATDVHGDDGIGGASRLYPPLRRRLSPFPAHRFMTRILRAEKGITICATGPLTNLALLLRHAPSAFRRVKELVIMGGGFDGERNTGPVAEFNFFVDPVAADMVLNSGVPIRLVPLNATHRCILTSSDIKSLPQSAVRTFLLRITRRYFAFHRRTSGFDGGYMHDALAMAAVGTSTLLTYTRGHVVVEPTDTYTRGMSIFVPEHGGPKDAELPPWMHRTAKRPVRTAVGFDTDPARFRRAYLSILRRATS